MTPAQRKGYLFEAVVRAILARNGWSLMQNGHSSRYKKSSNYNIELRGRGTWHQIDSPCIFKHHIPFTYPLRLIVEAKCHKHPVSKAYIRSFIAVIKDISENYFVDPSNPRPSVEQTRYSDIGAFFSASGFNREAINLAYAHGIRTISYRTNPLFVPINEILDMLAEGLIGTRLIVKAGGANAFVYRMEKFLLGDEEVDTLIDHNGIGNEFVLYHVNALREKMYNIKSSLIGSTVGGGLLNLLGEHSFPDELFERRDTRLCRVFYENRNNNGLPMWLEITDDPQRRRFYFDVPLGLEEVIASGGAVLDAKRKYFSSIQVYREINNVGRSLNLAIDQAWINELKQREHRRG